LYQGHVVKGTDPGLQTPRSKVNGTYAVSLANPDAFAAENALVGIIGEKRVAGVDRQITRYAPESLQFELETLMGSDFLQFALLVLGATAAVEMVV
jgi:hypothetical protein